MNYPEGLADKIGFTQIKDQISQHCLSTMGQEFVDKMRFSNRFSLVKQWVKQVDEMKSILSEHGGEWPQVDFYDLRSSISPLSLEGHYLSAEEWRDWQRGLDVLHQCIRFFNGIEPEKFPEISQITCIK